MVNHIMMHAVIIALSGRGAETDSSQTLGAAARSGTDVRPFFWICQDVTTAKALAQRWATETFQKRRKTWEKKDST